MMEDYTRLCMNCFHELNGAAVCPHCGYEQNTPQDADCLPPGTVIADRFLIGRARGQDETGIVYNVLDLKKNVRRRMREFFPPEDAARGADGSVEPLPGHEAAFNEALERMRLNAENSEDADRKYIFVRMNGTGYFIERKVKAPAAEAPAPAPADDGSYDDEEGGLLKRLPTVLIVMCVAVVLIVVGVIVAIRACATSTTDRTVSDTPLALVTNEPTYNPQTSPSATPYTTGDPFEPIDPIHNDWMSQEPGESMPTAKATVRPTSTVYNPWAGIQDDIDNSWGHSVPTITATPTPVPNRRVVNKNSSRAEISSLQWQLIELGWLNADEPTGSYDAATVAAVKAFQTYVNKNYKAKLTVDGICGPATFKYLDNYSIAVNPSPSATAGPDNGTISADSSPVRIRELQLKLIAMGWLDGEATGKYDNATYNAVMAFQNYVNVSTSSSLLTVNGLADANTQLLLGYERFAKPKETTKPTEAPTAAPTVDPHDETDLLTTLDEPILVKIVADQAYVYERASDNAVVKGRVSKNMRFRKIAENENWVMLVNDAGETGYTQAQNVEDVFSGDQPEDQNGTTPDSPKADILALQNALIERGWLAEGEADGVYGQNTKDAVAAFQAYVNEVEGAQILNVTGLADENTKDYLLDEKYVKPQPTAQPTATAEPEPTGAPFVALDPEETVVVTVDRLTVYSQPKEDANLAVGAVAKGASMTLVAENGEWGYVRNSKGAFGYTLLSGLRKASVPTEAPTTEPTAEPTAEPTDEPIIFVDVEGTVYVRVAVEKTTVYLDAPDTNSVNSMQIKKGFVARLVAQGGEWYELFNEKNNMTAYGLAADFELVEPTETATTEPTTAPTTEPTKDTRPDYLDDTYTDPDGEYTMRVSAEQTTIYFEDGRTANLPKGTALRLVALGSRWIQVRSEADGVIAYARMEDFVLDPTEAPTTEPTVEPTTEPTAEPTPTPAYLKETYTDASEGQRVRVTAKETTIYTADGKSYTLSQNAEFALVAVGQNWIHIRNEKNDAEAYGLAADFEILNPEPAETPMPAYLTEDYTDASEGQRVRVTAKETTIYGTNGNSYTLSQNAEFALVAVGQDWILIRNEAKGLEAYGLAADFEILNPEPAETSMPAYLTEDYTDASEGQRVRVTAKETTIYGTNGNSYTLSQNAEFALVAVGQDWILIRNEAKGLEAYGLAADFEILFPTAAPTDEPTPEPTDEPTVEPTDTPEYLTEEYTDVSSDNLTVRVIAAETTVYMNDGRTATLPKGASVRLVAEGMNWLRVRNDKGLEAYARYADFEILEPTPEPTEEPTPEPTEEPTPEPTEEPTPETTPYTDEWMQDKKSVKAFVKALVDGGWLDSELATVDIQDENVLNAIRDFQLWYEENVGETLESIFDDEGNFIGTIDEDTYEAIMSGLYSNK